MKFQILLTQFHWTLVAPFAGAWIEIQLSARNDVHDLVAPFAGAWIEISILMNLEKSIRVAPFAGAWIEIHKHPRQECHCPGRSLRGSVD